MAMYPDRGGFKEFKNVYKQNIYISQKFDDQSNI